jgi:hypothetical protein
MVRKITSKPTNQCMTAGSLRASLPARSRPALRSRLSAAGPA